MNLSDYLAQNPKQVIITDFDGTVAYLPVDWDAYKVQLLERFCRIDEMMAARYHTSSILEIINAYVSRYPTDAAPVVYEWSSEFESKYIDTATINRAFADFLQQNQDKYRFCIWSSNLEETIRAVLKRFDLEGCFADISGRRKSRYLKPDLAGFLLLHPDPAVPLSAYLMIGNGPEDEGAAQNAGIDFLWVDDAFPKA